MRIGIYQSYWGVVGGGQRYVAVVAELLAREHEVEIVHHAGGFERTAVEEPMDVDLSAVRFRYVPRPGRPAASTSNPWARLRQEQALGAELSRPYDLFIDSSDTPPYFCHAKRGALLIHFPLTTFEEFHGWNTPEWQRRSAFGRWVRGTYHHVEWRRRFASYPLCLVNSEYTRHWLKRLWGLDAQVVYPPLREGFQPEEKEKLILSIGAFDHAEHKKHDVLIEAFKRLCDDGLRDWRYVQVGAARQREEDQQYVARLRARAADYPIEIRTDIPGSELKGLLERAAILWHSMGYGINAEQEPRRLEHFGMVATEAMAAGAIPIVFDGGGLREIVNDGQDGFRWSTIDRLRETTLRLAHDVVLRSRLAGAARQRADDFGHEAFERRLREALAPLLLR